MLKFLKSHIVMSIAVYGGAVAVLAAALWIAFQYVQPLPPSKVTIAAGGQKGAYYRYARQYAEIFAEEGIDLEVLETKGSMENLALMSDPKSGVSAAFMQGGISTPEEHPDLRSLGSLYYEPLWVFYRADLPIRNLTDLKGRNVVIGPVGSGTNHVIKTILTENGINAENANLIENDYSDIVPLVNEGKVDVLFFIAGAKSKAIETLCRPGSNMRLLSFARAEAYSRSLHYLNRLILPQGAINLAENLPDRDIDMLAPTANLVIDDDMHPAIKYLFLIAADKIHRKGDVFAMPGQFPNEKALLFPLSDEATSFYQKGPPLLMRYLPFQLAVTIERLKILLIPLLTLLYPLFKVTPPAYRWQIRRRIFKWYKELKALDTEAYDITDKEEARAMLAKLEALDRNVLETSVPLSYSDFVYSLRIHVSLIRGRLEKLIEGKAE